MPATMAEIHKVLIDSRFDESDRWVVRWQFGMLDGDFEKPLCDAIKCADEDNLERLALGFPVEVTGFRRWAYGDLGRRLRNAGLNI